MSRVLRLRTILLFVSGWTLSSAPLYAQTIAPLLVTGDVSKRVDLVIVGDGYVATELTKFASDIDQFLLGVFAQEPFKEYRNYFNVRRIDVASAESGADHPEIGVFKDTAFDATYNCGGAQRLICVSTSKVLDAVSVLSPSQRDLILVIVNDPEYGGSGGSVAVASTHADAAELILHEVGHTFAFLADEYTSQPPSCFDAVEPTQVNATKETDRAAIKWGVWFDSSTPVPTPGATPGVPGLYLGARYCTGSLYRPTYDSKMRSLHRSFEQINSEQFVKRFYDFASPIDSQSPASNTLELMQGQPQEFSVVTPSPATHPLNVSWKLNGQDVATGPVYTLSTDGLILGSHTVTAIVGDSTPMVRNDPQTLLNEQTTWNITLVPNTKKVRGQVTSQ